MSDRSRTSRPHAPGMLVLGACTLWLILQNTLLALGLLWLEPRKVVTLVTMICKAGVLVINAFWHSPAAPLLIGVVLIAALLIPVLLSRAPHREVIHG